MFNLCTCDGGMSSCLACDWVGFGESPRVTEALTGLESAECSVASFNNNLDNITMADTCDPYYFSMPSAAEWMPAISTLLPFLPPPPPSVLSDDTGSSTGTLFDPLSPVSEETLPCSPFDEYVPDFALAPGIESQYACNNVAALDGYTFAFRYPSPSVSPSSSSSCVSTSPTTPYFTGVPDIGHGQPVSQHEVGAAATDVYGLVPLSLPEEKPNVKRHKHREDDDYEEKPRSTKRRKRQDTTPKLPCPQCAKKFARSHNLRVHIKSVHEGSRAYACMEPNCTRSFSRKHDLIRHIQSKHTNLGSPRRKSPKVAKDADSE
ncbi:hypothetical protein C8T65DRAFT_671679 [Cerioporus squamosus]|nr:hypothetical protein C8T65DRAFT_671679 [Cerioporus squamosus]